jgi:hypothetical protein
VSHATAVIRLDTQLDSNLSSGQLSLLRLGGASQDNCHLREVSIEPDCLIKTEHDLPVLSMTPAPHVRSMACRGSHKQSVAGRYRAYSPVDGSFQTKDAYEEDKNRVVGLSMSNFGQLQ